MKEDKALDAVEKAIDKSFERTKQLMLKSTNDGILIGYDNLTKLLNDFIDKKIDLKGVDYITRTELNIFSETIIKVTKDKFKTK